MVAKDEIDGSDVSKMVYSFGPRFFVEVTIRLCVCILCLVLRVGYPMQLKYLFHIAVFHSVY